MADQNQTETVNVSETIDRAANAEREGLVSGAMQALSEDASRARGLSSGRTIAAGATEKRIALDLGFTSTNDLRQARRGAPEMVLAALIGGARR